jgi:hypothetical protein
VFWLVTRPVVWPVRSFRTATVVGFRAGRLLGYRRVSYLAVGVAIGLLVAPVPGRELRRRLRERSAPETGPELVRRFRERFSAEPRLAPVVDLRAVDTLPA